MIEGYKSLKSPILLPLFESALVLRCCGAAVLTTSIARPVRTLPRPIPPLAHGRHGRRVTERVTFHQHLSFICSGIVPVL